MVRFVAQVHHHGQFLSLHLIGNLLENLGPGDLVGQGGDHDVAFAGQLDDPVVRLIQALLHDHQRHLPAGRIAHVAVGDQGHLQAVAVGDLVDLVLHGTGVGIDVYVQHQK